MYNEQIKNGYLEFLDNDKRKIQLAKRIFNSLESLEIKHQTDIYDMPFDVLLPELLAVSNISSYILYQSRYYTIVEYKTWALKHNLVTDYAKAYIDDKVDLKNIFLKYNTMVIYRTPRDFAKHLNSKLVRKSDEDDIITIDEICKAFAMLIYQGFDPVEALNIRVSDVQINNNNVAIITSNRIVVIYPEFKYAIVRIAKRRTYQYKHANMCEYLKLSEYLIDNGKNANASHRRQNIMTIFSMRQLNLKLKDVRYMGLLYDYYSHHAIDSNRQDIFEYCFGGDKLTKTKREQFYRFIELWNV